MSDLEIVMIGVAVITAAISLINLNLKKPSKMLNLISTTATVGMTAVLASQPMQRILSPIHSSVSERSSPKSQESWEQKFNRLQEEVKQLPKAGSQVRVWQPEDPTLDPLVTYLEPPKGRMVERLGEPPVWEEY